MPWPLIESTNRTGHLFSGGWEVQGGRAGGKRAGGGGGAEGTGRGAHAVGFPCSPFPPHTPARFCGSHLTLQSCATFHTGRRVATARGAVMGGGEGDAGVQRVGTMGVTATSAGSSGHWRGGGAGVILRDCRCREAALGVFVLVCAIAVALPHPLSETRAQWGCMVQRVGARRIRGGAEARAGGQRARAAAPLPLPPPPWTTHAPRLRGRPRGPRAGALRVPTWWVMGTRGAPPRRGEGRPAHRCRTARAGRLR